MQPELVFRGQNSQTVSIRFINWQNLFILNYIHIVQHALENIIGTLGSESVRRECQIWISSPKIVLQCYIHFLLNLMT